MQYNNRALNLSIVLKFIFLRKQFVFQNKMQFASDDVDSFF
jgi:hypothetical protein